MATLREADHTPATVFPKSQLTLDEAAALLGIGREDVSRLVAKGRLAAVTVGGVYKVPAAEIDKAAAAGRLAGDLKRPTDWASNLGAEQKTRRRLLESLEDVLTDAAIRAEMARVARPSQKVWDVRGVQFEFQSAPLEFLEAMGAPATAGEFQARIKGQELKEVEALRTAYLRSRAYKAGKSLLGVNRGPDSVYETREKFAEFIGQVVDQLANEDISVRQTRLIEFQTSAIEMGEERQVIFTKTPVDVSASVPLASVVGSGLRLTVESFF